MGAEPRPDATFIPGLVVEEEFFDYKEFRRGAKNHWILSRYRLGSGPFYGVHDGIQLPNMQLGHADRYEGVLNDGIPPKECLTFAVVQRAEGAVCVDRVPLGEGEMIVVDDHAPYRFASSGRVRLAVVSIRKTLFGAQELSMPDRFPAVYHENVGAFSALIDALWVEGKSRKSGEMTLARLEAMEREMMQSIAKLFASPTLPAVEHGAGALAAFDARDYLLEHLDSVETVEALAARFNVSYRTLETSFRTLFGITPKQLMDILRLNRAHEALCRANPKECSVTDVAMQWGFKHLGRFARRHKAMFGTYPKEALHSEPLEPIPS